MVVWILNNLLKNLKTNKMTHTAVKNLAYYKANAEEDYLQVPISVLRYILLD